jgi:hypothetical protein
MANRIDSVKDFAFPVLAAFGIDSKYVTGFTINCHACEPVTITVTRIAPGGAGIAMAQVAEQYRLVLEETISLPDQDEAVTVDSLARITRLPAGSPE